MGKGREGAARRIATDTRRWNAMELSATVLAAFAAGPRQHDRLLRLHTPLGPDVLVAETLDGVESVDGARRAQTWGRINGLRGACWIAVLKLANSRG
ncbi:hypothetical protein GCM10028795_09270 [Lysobacter olei]